MPGSGGLCIRKKRAIPDPGTQTEHGARDPCRLDGCRTLPQESPRSCVCYLQDETLGTTDASPEAVAQDEAAARASSCAADCRSGPDHSRGRVGGRWPGRPTRDRPGRVRGPNRHDRQAQGLRGGNALSGNALNWAAIRPNIDAGQRGRARDTCAGRRHDRGRRSSHPLRQSRLRRNRHARWNAS